MPDYIPPHLTELWSISVYRDDYDNYIVVHGGTSACYKDIQDVYSVIESYAAARFEDRW